MQCVLRYREICRWGFVLIRSSFWDDFGDARHMMLLRLHHSCCVLNSSRAYLMLNQHQPKTTSLLLHGKWVMKFIVCVCVCVCHKGMEKVSLWGWRHWTCIFSPDVFIIICNYTCPKWLEGLPVNSFMCVWNQAETSLQQTASMSDLSTGLGIKFQNFYNIIRSWK